MAISASVCFAAEVKDEVPAVKTEYDYSAYVQANKDLSTEVDEVA